MAKALVTVVHPTEREDGTAATLAEIASWRVEMKAKAATNWSPLGGARLPAEKTATADQLTTGTYQFRAVWTDTDGQDSEFAETEYEVGPPPKLKPGAVSVSPA